jgi:hypothetical protein
MIQRTMPTMKTPIDKIPSLTLFIVALSVLCPDLVGRSGVRGLFSSMNCRELPDRNEWHSRNSIARKHPRELFAEAGNPERPDEHSHATQV